MRASGNRGWTQISIAKLASLRTLDYYRERAVAAGIIGKIYYVKIGESTDRRTVAIRLEKFYPFHALFTFVRTGRPVSYTYPQAAGILEWAK